METNINTNLLFSVAFFFSCWQPGVHGPAAEDQHVIYPPSLEPWMQHRLLLCRSSLSEILFPLSLVQTIQSSTESQV